MTNDGSENPTLGDAGAPGEATADAPGAIGPYRLLSCLGEGGFGVVYLAERRDPLVQRVAIKVVKPGMDSKAVIARFQQERQALALMDHPSIARILDSGVTEQRRPYFVMEYVRGEPITRYCDRMRLDLDRRLALFGDLCFAVEHAHAKGVIHRDLKPGNILVSDAEGGPMIKIIDFGVAKALHGRLTEQTILTEQGQLMGTPAYMSPEQAEMSGIEIDARTDIYALGVILYELVSGVRPFDDIDFGPLGVKEIQRVIREKQPTRPGDRLAQLRRTPEGAERVNAIAERRADSPARLIRRLQGPLGWIAMRCLEKERPRRYATAAALAYEVGCYLRSDHIRAAPPTLRSAIGRVIRRRRVEAEVAALVVAIGGAVLAIPFAMLVIGESRADARLQTAGVLSLLVILIGGPTLAAILGTTVWIVLRTPRALVATAVAVAALTGLALVMALTG